MAQPRINFVHPLLRARDYQNRPEFDRLCDWWRGGGQGVCALVGIGGAGKTAVADRFLRVLPGAMADDPKLPKDATLPAPAALFVFSFYDAPNPDEFVAELAPWLDHRPRDDSEKTYSYEQMRGLLQNAGECLLVLDGLEKVQDTGLRGGVFGQITDGRLRDFVGRVVEGQLRGISIIITTRFAMPGLEEERPPNYTSIAIDEISQQTGIDLLRVRGVRGTDLELRRIVNECGCHALTVDMAGGYIVEFGGGDPNTKLELGTVEELEEAIKNESDPKRRRVLKQEFRFARVARRYQEGFSESNPATLGLLQRVCLFRLGVDAKTLASIFTGDSKEEISAPELAKLSLEELGGKLQNLAAMRLIEVSGSEQDEDSSFSIHPAVRDGFLAGLDAETAQRGHDAARKGLEASLGGQSGDNPSNPATLDLLEEIVYHTFAAGHEQEAFDIYWNRIGSYRNLGWRLGEYERGERICRAFAEGRSPQTAPLPHGLSENDQAVFIIDWALYLSNLGRLDAAARCYERNIEIRTAQKNWKNASIGNGNLSEVSLLIGRLVAGLRAAEEARRMAKRADDRREKADTLVYRGHARALQGDATGALIDFRDSLHLQHEEEGETDRPLYSLGGIWHSLLLICLGQHRNAAQLTETNLEIWARENERDGCSCNLVLADLARERGDLPGARELLVEAHEWAIARNAKEHLCRSALVQGRIELTAFSGQRSAVGDQLSASEDRGGQSDAVPPVHLAAAKSAIEDGLRIARDCGFGIYHIDLLLLRARVALHEGRAADAERDIRLALDEGVHPPADTGLPELLAATDKECGYAWGIAEARHLLAEALLLQAAQNLGQTEFAPARFDSLPDDVTKLIEDARGQLTQCAELRKQIQDPKLTETEQVLDDLRGGALTNYPLKPPEKDPAMIKTVVELDLVSYSTIAKTLEEGLDVHVGLTLNDQIQGFVDKGLEAVGAPRDETVMQTTGDGAILVFGRPADAHRFADAVHQATREHNRDKTESVGKRVFRIGAATGELVMQPRPGGGYDIAGATIARAVRLEAKADPGGILVDQQAYEGLTAEQKQRYGSVETVSGKRDERFEAYRCVLNPDARHDAALLSERQKPAVVQFQGDVIKGSVRGTPRGETSREVRRAILRYFNLLKPHQFDDLIFLLDVPISRRPSDALDLEGRKTHVLKWAEEEQRLEELLDELTELVEGADTLA